MENIVAILYIFDDATEEISGEKYVTVSLIIPIVYCLNEKLNAIKNDLNTNERNALLSRLIDGTVKRLTVYETRTVTGLLLDPGWEKTLFRSSNNAHQAQIKLKNCIGHILKQNETETTSLNYQTRVAGKGQQSNFFKILEEKKETAQAGRTKTVAALIVTKTYLEEHPLPQEVDILPYWKNCSTNFKPLGIM